MTTSFLLYADDHCFVCVAGDHAFICLLVKMATLLSAWQAPPPTSPPPLRVMGAGRRWLPPIIDTHLRLFINFQFHTTLIDKTQTEGCWRGSPPVSRLLPRLRHPLLPLFVILPGSLPPPPGLLETHPSLHPPDAPFGLETRPLEETAGTKRCRQKAGIVSNPRSRDRD